MTIAELERRSGLARANIRFYEAEGLLRPALAGGAVRARPEARRGL